MYLCIGVQPILTNTNTTFPTPQKIQKGTKISIRKSILKICLCLERTLDELIYSPPNGSKNLNPQNPNRKICYQIKLCDNTTSLKIYVNCSELKFFLSKCGNGFSMGRNKKEKTNCIHYFHFYSFAYCLEISISITLFILIEIVRVELPQ